MKASVEKLKGPLSLERVKKQNLEKAVANYDVNVMGYHNAKGSLDDIRKRLKAITEEKTALEKKKRTAQQ